MNDKISAVIAYGDRMPLNERCDEHGYHYPDDRLIRGRHFRRLLNCSVQGLAAAGVNEIIVVNFNNIYYPEISVPGASVINYGAGEEFSEWDAKWLGIEHAVNDLIVTVNADILVLEGTVCWFREQAAQSLLSLYQGTKGWLNHRQTDLYLKRGVLDPCMHEVLVDVLQGTEWPIEGVEPESWSERRPAAEYYRKETGLDLWKHSGDFQAFHRAILDRIEYPRGSSGWGWGDIEIRLRVREAGLKEVWNRLCPVWHLAHPCRDWRERAVDCKSNMKLWNRNIDWEAGGGSRVEELRISESDLRNQSGAYCQYALRSVS